CLTRSREGAKEAERDSASRSNARQFRALRDPHAILPLPCCCTLLRITDPRSGAPTLAAGVIPYLPMWVIAQRLRGRSPHPKSQFRRSLGRWMFDAGCWVFSSRVGFLSLA